MVSILAGCLREFHQLFSIFFVCDLNSCILIKTSRVQGKGQAILPPTFSSALELKSELEQT